MAIPINSIELLKSYLNGVMDRAGHHAGNVEGVALALLGAVMWKSTGGIAVRMHTGRPANIIWFEVGKSRYALAYHHTADVIELRERTLRGKVMARFNNVTTYQEVIAIFNTL